MAITNFDVYKNDFSEFVKEMVKTGDDIDQAKKIKKMEDLLLQKIPYEQHDDFFDASIYSQKLLAEFQAKSMFQKLAVDAEIARMQLEAQKNAMMPLVPPKLDQST